MKPNDIPYNQQSIVKHHTIARDDPQHQIVAGMAILQNQGTTRVFIDDHIVLDPIETITFGDFEGGSIVHDISVKFLTLANPPAADFPKIRDGNRLLVTIIRRKTYKDA